MFDPPTYEVTSSEPLHPDKTVVARLREIGIGDCDHGCKVYGDPLSSVTILGHNSAYGCKK